MPRRHGLSQWFPAFQLVFGSNTVDPFGRGAQDEDLLFTQGASAPGQLVQHWKLRTTAQEAAMKEVAERSLRRLLAYDKAFRCTDGKIGDSVLCY